MSTIRFLLLEDNPLDVETIQAMLTDGGIDYELLGVDTRADFVAAIETKAFDLILAAYALPSCEGISALKIARNLCPETPFIFVSASLGEELAIETLKQGATDYVLKQRLERLVPAVNRALQEAQERRHSQRGEAARSRNEARLRAVAAHLPHGAAFILDRDLRYLLAEGDALEGAGMTSFDLVGKTIWDALDSEIAKRYEPYFRQALGGESFSLEHCSHERHYISHGTPLRDERGEVDAVLAVSYDITERKRVELNAEFLAIVSQELVGATTVDEIVQTVGKQLHRYLNTSICALIEINEQIDEAAINYDWHQDDLSSLVGVYSLVEFVSGEFLLAAKAGHPVVVRNYATDPRVTDPSRYAALGIGAEINIPLIRNGKWKFSLTVFHQQPYDWRDDEIKLMQELASRVWAKLERARAEAALRESEEKYRTLFNSIDEGFCICEMLFDENGKSTDYRFLEVNSVFGKLTGLEQAAGKTARELIPDLEADWFELYGKVVQTGEPARFEQQSIAMNRWFDVNVFGIGEAQSHQFAVLFTNITERKRAEVALRQSEEQSRNILESITDAFFALDENWRFTYVNQTAYTMVNRTPGDLIGKNFWSEFPGVNDSQFEQMHRRVMRSRIAESLTEFYPDHGRWYEVRTYPAANGVTIYFKNVTEQIQAESALRQSEARFRRIFECKMVPMGVYTSTGGISEANDALLHLIGYTRQELVAGRINWQELTPPQYWSLDEFALSEIATKGFSTAYEKVYIHKDGRQVPILIGAASFLDAPSSGVFFVVDLTERKLAEANLREAHVQLESALAAGSVYTWRWKISEDLVIVNTAFAHLFGVDPETAASGLPIELFVQAMHAEDRSRVVAAINQAIATGEEYISEYRVYTAMGEERWLAARGRVEYASDGRPLAFPGALADITERKRAEEDRDRFFQLSRDMLAIINTDGYFIQANPAWTETLGYTTQELTAQPYIEFVHPDDRAATTDEAQTLAQGSPTNGFENRYRCRDGSYRWISWSVAPFVEQGLLYCVARDVTERKLAEAERERLLLREQSARAEAEQANRLKDEFLAVLSHELRSPLNPILGWARLLQNGKLDATRQAEALKTIERNARLQSQLIEDLLDISRIMQGKLSLTAAPINLTFVISCAIETVRLAAEAKNIALTLDLDNTIAPISGDAARLQQVVWNLLTNAVKFTPNGGQVTVELRHLDRLAQIRVIDTGKGINPQFLPHVFEYFRQEDGSTTRRFGGLGLGLAIARQIVEMHGGTVTAESQGENQGATFIVQLPLMHQATSIASEPTRAPADTAAPLDNRQILLVDDEPDTREFQAFLLEQSGAKVTAVASGLEALQAMDKLMPDVIVSDIGMAQMDGYMLIGLLRARSPDRGGTIPAIALTAYAAEVDQQRAIGAGFQTFITKPVEPETLVQAIISLLERNQQ